MSGEKTRPRRSPPRLVRALGGRPKPMEECGLASVGHAWVTIGGRSLRRNVSSRFVVPLRRHRARARDVVALFVRAANAQAFPPSAFRFPPSTSQLPNSQTPIGRSSLASSSARPFARPRACARPSDVGGRREQLTTGEKAMRTMTPCVPLDCNGARRSPRGRIWPQARRLHGLVFN